ncbi:MAG: zinc metallopeptidase [Clostridia bacterium]|nr:zinc metallopeptidase [Clostridia bacterium]
MYLDSTYLIFVLPAMLLAFWAQFKVNSTYEKFSKVQNHRGITGAEVAVKILNLHGIYNVRVEHISGKLSDHFDPRSNVIRLSDGVYSGTSVAALGVAAHETGHAIQHAKGYMPIKLRNAIVPVASLGSNLAVPLAIFGLIFSMPVLIDAGIILFTAVVAFQFVTLPVEFNASRRAISVLDSQGILYGDELKGAKKVLSAAALTYVAAAAVALGNLLRLLALRGRRD